MRTASLRRRLNMQSGRSREIPGTPAGKQVLITSQRLVSSCIARGRISYRVTLLNAEALSDRFGDGGHAPSAAPTRMIRGRRSVFAGKVLHHEPAC